MKNRKFYSARISMAQKFLVSNAPRASHNKKWKTWFFSSFIHNKKSIFLFTSCETLLAKPLTSNKINCYLEMENQSCKWTGLCAGLASELNEWMIHLWTADSVYSKFSGFAWREIKPQICYEIRHNGNRNQPSSIWATTSAWNRFSLNRRPRT